MTPPVRLSLECLSSSLKPFHVVGRDGQGRTLWTIRERSAAGGLLRWTKFRAAMGLVLEMDGPPGRFLLYRPPSLWIQRKCTLRDPTGTLRVTLNYGFLRCKLLDPRGQPLGEARFSNPTSVGRDRGVLIARQGFPVARLTFRLLSFWSGRWHSEVQILVHPEEWEPPAVALAVLRLAEKQMR